MVSQTAPEPQALDEELKALRLSTIRRNYRDCAIQAAKETLGCEAYLQELVSRELEARRVNRITRLLHGSRLPRDKTLDAFDMGRLPRRISQQVRSLLDGSFLARRENILAFGNPGSGKTHLLCAIGHSLIQQGHKVYFSTCSTLVQELLRAKRDLILDKALKKLSGYEALIIDDIGYVQQNREEMEVLFSLLAHRYERGSIILARAEWSPDARG